MTGSAYQEIPLSADPSGGTLDTRIAVTSDAVFFYGGSSLVDPDGSLPQGKGAVLDLGTEKLSEAPVWPYSHPPFSPGVVAVGSQVVVLGTPCAAVVPSEGAPKCGDTGRAAVFDPASMSWTKVSAPSEQIGVDGDGAYAEIYGLGGTDTMAFFIYTSGGVASKVIGFDVKGESWHDFGEFNNAGTHCVTPSGLVRGYVSPSGQLVADRLDTGSGEWRPVPGGEPSSLTTSDPDAGQVTGSGDTQRPQVQCAGDQLIAFAFSTVPDAMFWFNDEPNAWFEVPPPAMTGFDFPRAAVLDGVLVLWPNARYGSPQAVATTAWTPLDGAPRIQPLNVATRGDEIIVIGQAIDANGSRTENYTAGRLTLQTK